MNWKKWLGLIVVLALVVFVGYSLVTSGQEDGEGLEVRTDQVQRSSITEEVTSQGLIQAVDQQEVVGTGLVEDLHVAEGDQVVEGDPLVDYLEMGEVTADFDGTVTQVNVEAETADSNAQQGQASILVESLDNLEVKLDLAQNDAQDISLEDPVSLDYHGQEFQGQVSYLAPAATNPGQEGQATLSGQQSSNTLEARVAFDDDQDLDPLVAGFEIDLAITVDEKDDALLAPIEAVIFDDQGQAILFKVEDGQARQVLIETGLQSDLYIEVADLVDGDLQEGDQVILSPEEGLADGDQVKVKDQKATG